MRNGATKKKKKNRLCLSNRAGLDQNLPPRSSIVTAKKNGDFFFCTSYTK